MFLMRCRERQVCRKRERRVGEGEMERGGEKEGEGEWLSETEKG